MISRQPNIIIGVRDPNARIKAQLKLRALQRRVAQLEQAQAESQRLELAMYESKVYYQSLFDNNHHDVTERKQAEEKLQVLSEAVKQSPYSILITDKDGKIQYANLAFSQLSGYSFEEIKDQNPRLFKTELTSSEVNDQMWQAVTSGQTFNGRTKKG